jgi:type II secretory pathway component PulF
MAEIQVIVAEEQSKSAQKLEQQTDTLISLTRWLFRLTWILVVLTAGLLVFTYFLVKHG